MSNHTALLAQAQRDAAHLVAIVSPLGESEDTLAVQGLLGTVTRLAAALEQSKEYAQLMSGTCRTLTDALAHLVMDTLEDQAVHDRVVNQLRRLAALEWADHA